jgi:hypothetical protein
MIQPTPFSSRTPAKITKIYKNIGAMEGKNKYNQRETIRQAITITARPLYRVDLRSCGGDPPAMKRGPAFD